MNLKEKSIVLDEKGMKRVLDRVSHELLERNKGADNLVIVGMQTRGIVLARRIAENIQKIEGVALEVGVLDVTLYRDDYRKPLKQPAVQVTDIPFSIEGKDVILVDDVLFTGRTARAALDALIDFGRAKTIQFVVLIDRGHREFPIHADYVGKQVTTSPNEEILVRVQDVDQKEGVWLVELPA
jgi:pyrimidine operon attenuation protein / uracil phosphoribosyltransferase